MKKPNISFEFFPPKTPEGIVHLNATAKTLASLSPEFFSVTFGAGGSTQSGTEETVLNLHQSTGVESVPHLSCIGSTQENLTAILEKYKSQREMYQYYMNNRHELDAKLQKGADKARVIARATLKRLREKLGYKS